MPGFGVVLALTAVLAADGPAGAQAPTPEVRGVWIVSSECVDTSTPEAIVKSLVKDGMTDEQKVMAIFNWYRWIAYPAYFMGSAADEEDDEVFPWGRAVSQGQVRPCRP